MKDRPATAHEQRLSHALAVWLRHQMIERLQDTIPEDGFLHDHGQSNYETACYALFRVGVFETAGQCTWRDLTPNAAPVLPTNITRLDLDHLLDALACHSDYVDELYLQNEPVTPKDALLGDVCQAMVECGYMTNAGHGQYEWDDNFSPWFVRHGAWPMDDFERATDEQIDAALTRMPQAALTELSDRLCAQPTFFVRRFFAHWINGTWQADVFNNAPNDDWDIPLAVGIYQRLHP